ncbi:MAG: hypothetical protein M1820_005239 [Bogoriella megaspora]|nr:MAG: hypothetical protein M1820_005239 [Bogoriella megaspora]
MVLGTHRRNRSSTEEFRDPTEDETVVDADQGNVLMHIIKQLRPGADLSRVTLPTFILEPRSMLERITKYDHLGILAAYSTDQEQSFMAHPDTLLPMPKIDDPVQRFVSVVKFYLSGWHIKPPGVKKPLNPILGEIFTCYWDYPDKTRGYYISEQTSHHPPKSSYFFMAPEHHIRIDGTLKPRSKFLGTSAASMMEGIAVMRFLNRGERFFITQPNMYARNIIVGKMQYELGDHSFVRCPESGLEADIEFKTKGWIGGNYNVIGGYIKDTKAGKNLYELSGMWSGEMFIKDLSTGKKDLLYDATNARAAYPQTRPQSEQGDRESQKLWAKTATAVRKADHRAATDDKSWIEDRQREEASQREKQGLEWQPQLFRPVRGGPGGSEEGEESLDWIIDANLNYNASSQDLVNQVLSLAPIVPGQKSSDYPPESRNDILAKTTSSSVPAPTSTQSAVAPQPMSATQADLIDFGQHDASKVSPPTQNSSTSYDGSAPPPGLQQPLVPTSSQGHDLRQDSIAGSIDEFVDAES